MQPLYGLNNEPGSLRASIEGTVTLQGLGSAKNDPDTGKNN